MRRFAVLISGSGSNLQAIIDAVTSGAIDGDLALVLSNNADAYGLERARQAGIPAEVLSHRDFQTREAFDDAMATLLLEQEVDLVVLAGFMRILTPRFLRHFEGRVINVHPSLLPSFPGNNAPQQALNSGAKISGCTVHFVEEAVDAGPYIAQEAVPVKPGDDRASLVARIQQVEHRLYPWVVQKMLNSDVSVEGRMVRIAGGDL